MTTARELSYKEFALAMLADKMPVEEVRETERPIGWFEDGQVSWLLKLKEVKERKTQ